jgi:hypothetical protein
MTPEQFVFWLSGYLVAGSDNESLVNDIKEALKEVKSPHNSTSLYTGCL